MFQNTFPDRDTMAELTASMLLEIDAVQFRAEQPYRLTSGLASPVYIDCRKVISYPRIRSALMDFAVSRLASEAGFEAFDAVAGGETAGIPFAAWIAERMGLPMLYVRKDSRGFGPSAQIEGDLMEGQHVLLVEDLITDGGSKLKFTNTLRSAGAITNHALVIFYYDVFPDTDSKLRSRGLNLHYLSTWWECAAVMPRKELLRYQYT